MQDGVKIEKPLGVRLFDELKEAHREAARLPTWLLKLSDDKALDAYKRVVLDAVAVGIGRSGQGQRANRELDAAGSVALLAVDAIGTEENRPYIDSLIALVDAAKAYAANDAEGFRAHLDSFNGHSAPLRAESDARVAAYTAKVAASKGKEAAPEVVAAPA